MQYAEQQILFEIRLGLGHCIRNLELLVPTTSFWLRLSLWTSLLADVSTGQKRISFLSYRDLYQQVTLGEAASD